MSEVSITTDGGIAGDQPTGLALGGVDFTVLHPVDVTLGPSRPCPRIIQSFLGQAWAILPDKLLAIAEFIAARAVNGAAIDVAGMVEAAEARAARPGRAQGGVAVIPMIGVLAHRMNMLSAMSGGTSVQKLSADIDAALNDSAVGSILLDIDSPGGSVEGIQELGDRIFEARKVKPIVAVANAMTASAAYWLGSQATELSVTPSGQVGSIGVVAMHEDWSANQEAAGIKTTFVTAGKFKVEGNSYEPLNAEAHGAIQAVVDDHYAEFVAAVARGRGVGKVAVRDGYGQGRMVRPKAALAEGMVDRIETFDQALSRLLGQETARGNRMRAEAVQNVRSRRRRLHLATA